MANRSESLLIVDRHPLHVDRSDLAYSARNPHSSTSISSSSDLKVLKIEKNELLHLMVQFHEQRNVRL